MGWTGCHRDKGMTNREWFEAEFPTTLTEHGTIIADATVKGAYYAAVKGTADDPDKVWALIVLIRWGRDYYNFTYKEMDENMGPGYHDAPAKVLDVLTPTDHEYATEWRATCRANLAKVAAAKAIKVGEVVEFAEPIRFTTGATFAKLVLVDRKANTFRPVEGEGYGLYKIPGWANRLAA